MKQDIKKGLLKHIQKDSFSIGTTNTENRTFSTGHVRWNWTPPHFFIDKSLFKLKNLAFSKQPHTCNRSNRTLRTGHVRWNWTPPHFFIDSLSKLKLNTIRSFQEQNTSSILILLQAFLSTFLIIIFILSKWEGISLLS